MQRKKKLLIRWADRVINISMAETTFVSASFAPEKPDDPWRHSESNGGTGNLTGARMRASRVPDGALSRRIIVLMNDRLGIDETGLRRRNPRRLSRRLWVGTSLRRHYGGAFASASFTSASFMATAYEWRESRKKILKGASTALYRKFRRGMAHFRLSAFRQPLLAPFRPGFWRARWT